jgi:hypothetical protein
MISRKRRMVLALLATLPLQLWGHGLDCLLPQGRGPGGMPLLLEPTSATEPSPPAADVITLAMLPDIQYYTKCHLSYLAAQTQWLAAQAAARNIRAAAFMGDLTEHNMDSEWSFVREQLAHAQDQVPLLLTTGNHDEGHNGTAKFRHSKLRKYFPEPPGIARTVLAETRRSGRIDNAYYRITLPHVTLGVLALEWAPRASTVKWANGVLSRYANDRVIIFTHAYLYDDSTRYDWARRGNGQLWSPLSYRLAQWESWRDRDHDGERLWNALVRRHSGVFLVLCGHVAGSGAGHLASRGDGGNLVQQVLANFQTLDEGGLGYLRLFEIQPDGRSMRMKTYSPSLGVFAIGDAQRGEFAIEPALW